MAKETQTKETLQRDYNIKCAELGQAVYKIAALEAEIEATEKQIEQTKRDLRYLNESAARLASKQQVTEAEVLEGVPSESAS